MTNNNVWNFSPGPAMLPDPVMQRVARELRDFEGSGVSVMEISHRSAAFAEVAASAQSDLRELLAVPDSHRILFLQGGASNQFALVPLNFCARSEHACYAAVGHWGTKALRVAEIIGRRTSVAAARPDDGALTPVSDWRISADAAYLHYVINETVDGLLMEAVPRCGDVPLICDASSWLLSEPVDVSRFGMLYASAQKNIGPAGLTVVIVSDALLEKPRKRLPPTMDYRLLAAAGSMENTPPTFAWYVAGLVLKWLKQMGGLKAMGLLNRAKADLLYALIDASELYVNTIQGRNRSRMNVVFRLREPLLQDVFLAAAAERGLIGLKGHSAVGGLRASLYNAMPLAGVAALAAFMREFEQGQ